jgi:hypothetical protein
VTSPNLIGNDAPEQTADKRGACKFPGIIFTVAELIKNDMQHPELFGKIFIIVILPAAMCMGIYFLEDTKKRCEENRLAYFP